MTHNFNITKCFLDLRNQIMHIACNSYCNLRVLILFNIGFRDGPETETSRSGDRLKTYPWSRLGATSKCFGLESVRLGLDLDLSGLEPIATNAI